MHIKGSVPLDCIIVLLPFYDAFDRQPTNSKVCATTCFRYTASGPLSARLPPAAGLQVQQWVMHLQAKVV